MCTHPISSSWEFPRSSEYQRREHHREHLERRGVLRIERRGTSRGGQPLAEEPQTIEHLLGDGAMGTLGRRFPASTRAAADTDAIQALTATLRTAERGSVTILATGPLTNIAVVLLLHPELVEAIDSVVLMGGSETSGNHTAAAEFNTYADPEAFDGLLRSGVKVRMFGLNLTRQVLITPAHEDRLRALGTERAGVIADHVGFYLRMIIERRPGPWLCTTLQRRRIDAGPSFSSSGPLVWTSNSAGLSGAAQPSASSVCPAKPSRTRWWPRPRAVRR